MIIDVPIDQFNVAALPTGTVLRRWLTVPIGMVDALRVPMIVMRGSRPGPTALVVAGVHGDEFEGVAALPALFGQIDPHEVSGTIIALTVCNPMAFAAQSRCTPESVDGANLARVFPGRRDGTPTERLAFHLFGLTRRVLGDSDVFVDLHSAGTRYRYLPVVCYRDIDGPARTPSAQAAREFSLGRLWCAEDQPGSFGAEVARAGIPTVGVEAPGQGGLDGDDVEALGGGLVNLLSSRGMVDRPRVSSPLTAARTPTDIVAHSDGLFRARVKLGDQVDQGAVLAVVEDVFGQTRESVTAPHAGEIWAIRTFGTVRSGDLVLWVTT